MIHIFLNSYNKEILLIFYFFILLLYPQSFNLEPALLMMNNPNSPEENIKDIKPLELNQSNILGQPEVNNAKTEMSIKRIEG
jgi:hypothetical protein